MLYKKAKEADKFLEETFEKGDVKSFKHYHHKIEEKIQRFKKFKHGHKDIIGQKQKLLGYPADK